MKKKYFFTVCAAMLLGAVALTSCSDDDDADVHGITYNRAYFDKARSVTTGSVLKTPVGVVATFSDEISAKATSPVSGNITLTVTVDNSLIDSYNTEHGTNYKPLPDGVITMDKTTLTIPAGAQESADTVHLAINNKGAEALTDTAGYLMPIIIKDVAGGDARKSIDAAVRYVHINYMVTTSLINDQATAFAGTKADLSPMKCIAATNLDTGGFVNLISGGWYARWEFKSDDTTASFVIDMGGSHKLAGFYIDSYVLKNAKISISDDNSNWTEVSETNGHKALQDYDYSTYEYNQEYVLYAPLQARYFKAELELDNSSWAWQYYKYISSLSLYFAD